MHETYNVCAVVGAKVKFEPMLTAAMSCTAEPHRAEATPEISPMVLESECSQDTAWIV